jgi:hypothetical protein
VLFFGWHPPKPEGIVMFTRILLLSCSLCIIIAQGAGQDSMPIVEGTRFLIGWIHPQPVLHEGPLEDANLLVVTSSGGATIRVQGGDPIVVSPGEARHITVDSAVDVLDVAGDRPFAVATVQAWEGNGEMAWHLPVAMWDTIYHPFLWWQDGFGLAWEPYTIATAKVRVIAATDATVRIMRGSATILDTVLQGGTSLLYGPSVDTLATRTDASDPTGWRIIASAPVGVIAGHAKGAIMRYPDAMPDTGAYARQGNFMRSNFHDAMMPSTMAGTTFVTAPLLYSPTRLRGTDQTRIGVEDDRGDVVRFIALVDGTLIRRDGELVATIDADSSWMSTATERASVWTTSEPTVCALYGKSYARITSQAGKPEDDPSTDAGLPLLMTVPSQDRWITSATFHGLPEFTNAVNVVCDADAVDNLFLDGVPLASIVPPRPIGTSAFRSLSGYVSAGVHHLSSNDPEARFMAWTYGSLDGLLPARIYGSIVGMDMTLPCADSIEVSTVYLPNTITITYQAVGDACARIAMAYTERCDGGVATVQNGSITIGRVTPTTMVDGVAVIVTRSGRVVRVPFHLDGTTSVDDQGAATDLAGIEGTVSIHDVMGNVVRRFDARTSPFDRTMLDGLPHGVYMVASHTGARLVVLR